MSEKRWCIEGRGKEWCQILRERYLTIEKLTDGLYQVLMKFVYSDEFAQASPEAWRQFMLQRSISWNEPGRKGLTLARKMLRAAYGLEALGPAPVRLMWCVHTCLHLAMLIPFIALQNAPRQKKKSHENAEKDCGSSKKGEEDTSEDKEQATTQEDSQVL